MASVLVTAFEPYDHWQENASWLAMIQLTSQLSDEPVVTTRRYPVDFEAAQKKLSEDLADGYDYAIHLGQSPRDALVTLEAVGLNVLGRRGVGPEQYGPLVDGGPMAYRTELPLDVLSKRLRDAQIPTRVSYHAGEYLCNAMLYLSHHLALQLGQKTQSLFVHLPLAPSQLIQASENQPTLPSAVSAEAVRLLLDELDRL